MSSIVNIMNQDSNNNNNKKINNNSNSTMVDKGSADSEDLPFCFIRVSVVLI